VTRSLSRRCGLIALVGLACGGSSDIASAQAHDNESTTTTSLAAFTARVPVGDVVSVTDATGMTTKGKLAEVADDAVQVRVKGGLRSIDAANIRRIQWQQPDSPLTGVLIGAGIGAIPGVYWLIADPNECFGMCPEEYVAIGVGAVVGGLIDHFITRNVTVYVADPASGRATKVAMGPLVVRDRKGLQVAVRF
jgi:hypothetical protein